MMKFRLNTIWAVAVAALMATACTSDQKSQEGEVANQDIVNAVELTFPETKVPQANAGYGKVLEVKSDNPIDQMYFSKEENSEWYYFKATETGRLGMVIKPQESHKDYNWLIYKKSGTEFAQDVVYKHILPLRSNLMKGTPGYDSTGLSCDGQSDFEGPEGMSPYSKPLDVEKDSIYYLGVNHSHVGGAGYTIRLFYCGAGSGDSEPYVQQEQDSIQTTEEIAQNLKPTTTTVVIPPPPTLPEQAAPEAMPRPANVPVINKDLPPLAPDEEYVVVTSRNTVYSISNSHDMKVIQLLRRNRLTNNSIFIGQKLIVKKKGAKQDIETPAVATNPTPTPTQSEPVAKPAEKEDESAPLATKNFKPTSTGAPAPPASLEAKNAVPEATQKLWVYVNVVNAKNNNPVNTIVQVVDGKNTKRIDRVPSNQLTYVPIYAEGNRRKIFVIDAFSFRKESFELDLDNLRNDSSANQLALVNDTVVLNFELERYKKNDIFAAYNIFFYDDASVMLPKSKFELESLLEMLKENPKVQIKIHGHTNSNSMGKIISLESDDHDFFRLTAKNKESFGTAQMLSKRRAESIKYYLTYNGVKDNRLQIKGWGGKKMIYERDVPLAHKNKRVEIEILED